MSQPLAYFITWTCYGTWLPGDARGSVDRHGDNGYGHPIDPPDLTRLTEAESRLIAEPYLLNPSPRVHTREAICEVCSYRGWKLLAAHVRTNHVHVVVSGDADPEKMLNDFKAYATRAIKRGCREHDDHPRWTRHGSTRYLWTELEVADRVQYVVTGQGEPMEVYVDPSVGEWDSIQSIGIPIVRELGVQPSGGTRSESRP